MLRPDTEQLWQFLKDQPSLSGFVLVGGTALAMHLGHRISEDFDFMIPQNKLPRTAIEILKRASHSAGFTFAANDSAEGLAEFEDTGMDYLDYQQDYVVADSVKLTLAAPEAEVQVLLEPGSKGGPRIAGVEEIFRLKCMACANRSKTRDWLDMYVMLTRGLFEPQEIYRTFEMARVPSKYDIAMKRLCSGKPDLLDEGYESLLAEPPSITQMQTYFSELRNEVEALAAAEKAKAMVLAKGASLGLKSNQSSDA